MRALGAVGLAVLVLTGCSLGSPGPDPAVSPGPSASPSKPTGGRDLPATTAPTPSSPATSTTGTGAATPTTGTGAATTTTGPGAIPGLPTEGELSAARADVANLDLHELAGQLVVASYPGVDGAAAAELVRTHHLGGVITLGGNVPEDPQDRVTQLTAMSEGVSAAVAEDGRDWPGFIGVDQEGGPITRIGAPLDRWPAAMALGAAGDPELAREVATASGEQLRALGYTAVFAPAADVTTGPDDPTIGARSPGSDPGLVASISAAQARGYGEAGLVPVVKHFPGHGSVGADSHLGEVRQPASLETLLVRDLVPFEHLVDEGAPAVMSAHIVLEDVDPGLPATLSPQVLDGLLRDDLGFEGLVVTDALNMAAVSDGRTSGDVAVLAVLAGADVLLMPPDPGAAVDALVGAMQDGTLSRDRVEESAARMVATLRARESTPTPSDQVIGSGHDLAVRAAGAAITQLSGPCGGRLVGEGIEVVGGSDADRALLREVAEEAGLGTGGGDVVALLGAPAYQAGGGGGGGTAAADGEVVVALDVPYPLAESTASSALLAAYGRDRATFEALVQVLLGEREAGGHLPVSVGGHPLGSGCGD